MFTEGQVNVARETFVRPRVTQEMDVTLETGKDDTRNFNLKKTSKIEEVVITCVRFPNFHNHP